MTLGFQDLYLESWWGPLPSKLPPHCSECRLICAWGSPQLCLRREPLLCRLALLPSFLRIPATGLLACSPQNVATAQRHEHLDKYAQHRVSAALFAGSRVK